MCVYIFVARTLVSVSLLLALFTSLLLFLFFLSVLFHLRALLRLLFLSWLLKARFPTLLAFAIGSRQICTIKLHKSRYEKSPETPCYTNPQNQSKMQPRKFDWCGTTKVCIFLLLSLSFSPSLALIFLSANPHQSTIHSCPAAVHDKILQIHVHVYVKTFSFVPQMEAPRHPPI